MAKTPRNAVQVMTVRASKGLEFYCVTIPNLVNMPSPKSTEAEDGRLLYLAMTRATHELCCRITAMENLR